MIQNIQDEDGLNWNPCDGGDNHLCDFFFKAPHTMFRTEFTIFSCYALLLLADSWLAYKTTLVSLLGIYFLAFMQLCFRSGRPFWDVSTITSNN